MKLNKITIFCLVSAAVLTAGVIVVQSAGFVSYEDNNKISFWDNVRMEGYGLKMSNWGASDSEVLAGGMIKILDKDIFVRGLLGFECTDYPNKEECKAAIGNIGNAFLKMDQVSSNTNLTLTSTNTNLTLNTLAGTSVIINGKLILKGGKYLFATNYQPLPLDAGYRVFVKAIKANELWESGEIGGDGQLVGLTLPRIIFDTVQENEASTAHPIVFNPKRLININLTLSPNYP